MPQATVVTQLSHRRPLFLKILFTVVSRRIFGHYCTNTRKGTGLWFWCKVCHAPAFFCCEFERDRWPQRREQATILRSGRLRRLHLDDGSFARLLPVIITIYISRNHDLLITSLNGQSMGAKTLCI